MADSTQARGRRSEARERRRSRTSEPLEEQDRSARSSEATPESNGDLTGAAAKIVGTAVAAGLLGALGGAAKALMERRGQEQQPPEEPGETEEAPEAEPEPQGHAEAASEEPEQQQEREPEHQPEQEREPEPEAAVDDAQDRNGVSEDTAAQTVGRARRQLEGLLGKDVERVSGLDRANGQWIVTLEVVELSRVPESTDVMATYEVALDGDGDLVSVNRAQRYRRSQVDDQS